MDSPRASVALLGVLAAGVCSCKSTATPVAPPVTMDLAHYAGAPLSGPRDPGSMSIDERPEDAWSLDFELWFLGRTPPMTLPLVSSRATVVVATIGRETLRAVPGLRVWAMVSGGAEAAEVQRRVETGGYGPAAPVESVRTALPANVTVELTAKSPVPVEFATGTEHRRLAIHVHRSSAGDLTVTLETERLGMVDVPEEPLLDPVEPSVPEGDQVADVAGDPVPDHVLSQELIVLEDRPTLDGPPLVLIMKSPFDSGGAFVACIGISSAPQEEKAHEKALARCLAELAYHTRVLPKLFSEELDPGAVTVEEAAVTGRRSALAIIAHACDAPVARDLALSADAALLDAYLERLGALDPERADMAWRLEREAYELLITLAFDGDLTPGLGAILLLNAGEAGRYPDQIELFLRNSPDRETFDEFLAGENLDSLTTSSPSSRTRAFEWLKARGLEPAGFDPLETNAARRQALRRYADALDHDEGGEGGEGGGDER